MALPRGESCDPDDEQPSSGLPRILPDAAPAVDFGPEGIFGLIAPRPSEDDADSAVGACPSMVASSDYGSDAGYYSDGESEDDYNPAALPAEMANEEEEAAPENTPWEACVEYVRSLVLSNDFLHSAAAEVAATAVAGPDGADDYAPAMPTIPVSGDARREKISGGAQVAVQRCRRSTCW